MDQKLEALKKAVRHLDMLNQFAIAAAERENPGFTTTLNNLAMKAEKLRTELGL